MHDSTRKAVFIVLGLVFLALVGLWWYSGFSLEFMRFFAAQPTPTPTPTAGVPTATPPPGCYYQEVQCFAAPCEPVLVCPSPSVSGMVQCAPETQNVKAGQAATLTATRGNGTYAWFAPESAPSTGTAGGATFQVSYQNGGIKKVTVQSVRGDASDNVDSVACTIVVNP